MNTNTCKLLHKCPWNSIFYCVVVKSFITFLNYSHFNSLPCFHPTLHSPAPKVSITNFLHAPYMHNSDNTYLSSFLTSDHHKTSHSLVCSLSHNYRLINSPQFSPRIVNVILFLNSATFSTKQLIQVKTDKDFGYSRWPKVLSTHNLQHQNSWPWVSYFLAFILIQCQTDRFLFVQSRTLLLTAW
jgi:hypothetical protein